MNTETRKRVNERAKVLDGKRVSDEIKSEVAAEVARLKREHNVTPCLVVIRVGEDPASALYVRNKVRTCEEVGIRSEQRALPMDCDTRTLLEMVASFNEREDVDGLLVQLPLPETADERRVVEAIDPAKDVDGFHPLNIGRLVLRQPSLVPCTPLGIMEMLRREGIEISGQRACVVGRSLIVGRPVAELLLQRDATVTVCHSRTRDLPSVTREADILIAAVGQAGFIRGEHVKHGAVVVDVGINKVTDEEEALDFFGEGAEKRVKAIRERGFTLVGDVHPDEVSKVAGWLTPVPGGVGLLTVAMLMQNTVTAARRRRGL